MNKDSRTRVTEFLLTSFLSAPTSTKERKTRAKEPKSNATLKRRKANKARKTHRK